MSKIYIGLVSNRWTVLEKSKERKYYWLCKCECGTIKSIHPTHLINGTSKSCGCLRNERIREACGTHLETYTRLYNIWYHMRNRCNNKNNKDYKYYGERGIIVCNEWNTSYQIFRDWANSNGYKDNLTIDRINVNGNYEPDNCKWIPFTEQQKNRRPFKRRKTMYR